MTKIMFDGDLSSIFKPNDKVLIGMYEGFSDSSCIKFDCVEDAKPLVFDIEKVTIRTIELDRTWSDKLLGKYHRKKETDIFLKQKTDLDHADAFFSDLRVFPAKVEMFLSDLPAFAPIGIRYNV